MAGIIKRFLGHLGLFKDENNEKQQPTVNSNATPSKGFSVKLEVPTGVVPQGPVVCQCFSGDGGVQGFRWYSQKLQVDEDGDIAEEFLDEVVPEITGPGDSREAPSFKVKLTTKPAKLRSAICTINGNVHQCVEHGGKLRWA